MKIKNYLFILVAGLLSACTEDTGHIGSSITNLLEIPTIMTDTFEVSCNTFLADSLYARSSYFDLGTLIDQESGDNINASFYSQFHTLEQFSSNLVDESKITSRDANGNIVADSCKIRFKFTSIEGDSIAHSVINIYEMKRSELLSEKNKYYTNYDVKKHARKLLASYTRVDSDSINTDIPITGTYTDEEGVTYPSYGTYLIRQIYAHPTDFNKSLTMAKKYLPGIYVTENVGSDRRKRMSLCYYVAVEPYYTYQASDTATAKSAAFIFPGTQEVLQFAHIEHDKSKLLPLVNDPNYVYAKSPAGLFTELTLPIDSIYDGHDKDDVNAVKISFNTLYDETALNPPSTLLILPKYVRDEFFENPQPFLKKLYAEEMLEDSTTNYLNTYCSYMGSSVSSYNYTFYDIEDLTRYLYNNKESIGPDWNKVLLIPITTTSNSSSEVMTVEHDMEFTSARFLRKQDDGTNTFRLSVFYTGHE